MQKIWKDRDISKLTKVRLVKALVFPVVIYACETWTLKEVDCRRIEAFENWCWRRVLRIPWTAMRTNESVRSELLIDDHDRMLIRINKQKLTFFGHVMRANGLEKAIMIGMGNGQRRKGRPRRRWLDEIEMLTDKKIWELGEMVRDRRGWRGFVNEVIRGRQRPGDTR